jgi:hypothetical protein
MRSRSVSAKRIRVFTGVLLFDLGYLWWSLLANDMLLVLHSSGLWLDYSWGLGWAMVRSIVLFGAYNFRYTKPWLMVLGLELMAGLLVSLVDIWVFMTADCECLLPVDGALVRLVVRFVTLVVVAQRVRRLAIFPYFA